MRCKARRLAHGLRNQPSNSLSSKDTTHKHYPLSGKQPRLPISAIHYVSEVTEEWFFNVRVRQAPQSSSPRRATSLTFRESQSSSLNGVPATMNVMGRLAISGPQREDGALALDEGVDTPMAEASA